MDYQEYEQAYELVNQELYSSYYEIDDYPTQSLAQKLLENGDVLVDLLSTKDLYEFELQDTIEIMEKSSESVLAALVIQLSLEKLLTKFREMKNYVIDAGLYSDARKDVQQFIDALAEIYHQHGYPLPDELFSLEKLENYLYSELEFFLQTELQQIAELEQAANETHLSLSIGESTLKPLFGLGSFGDDFLSQQDDLLTKPQQSQHDDDLLLLATSSILLDDFFNH